MTKSNTLGLIIILLLILVITFTFLGLFKNKQTDQISGFDQSQDYLNLNSSQDQNRDNNQVQIQTNNIPQNQNGSGQSQTQSNTIESGVNNSVSEVSTSQELNIPSGMNLFDSNQAIFSVLYPEELSEPRMAQFIGNSSSSYFSFAGSYLSSEDGSMYTGLSVSGYGDMFTVSPTQPGPEILINNQTKYLDAKNLYGGQVFFDAQGNEYFVGSGKTFPCDMGVICGNTQWVGVKKFNTPVNGISYTLVFGLKEIFSLEEFKQTMKSL